MYNYNKQNSKGFEDQASTEVHEFINRQKGYSSRYQKIKRKNIVSAINTSFNTQPLSIRMQKAAVVIQKYYRFRMYMKRKLYQRYLSQLESSNNLMRFQNARDKQILDQLQREFQLYEQKNQSALQQQVFQAESIVKKFIMQCVCSTFKMQKQKIKEEYYLQILTQNQKLSKTLQKMRTQREILKMKIQNQFNENQQSQLRQIRQENSMLLSMITQRGQLERRIRMMKLKIEKQELASKQFHLNVDCFQ